MSVHQARVAEFGSRKILAIKLVRQLSGLGLKEAKETVERGASFDVRVDGEARRELDEAARLGIRFVFTPPLDGAAAPSPRAIPSSSSSAGRFAVRYRAGARKIHAIKLVRELARCGLKEAKDIVEQQGVVVYDRSRAETDEIVRQFEAIGSQVELVPDDGSDAPAAVVDGGDADDEGDPWSDDYDF